MSRDKLDTAMAVSIVEKPREGGGREEGEVFFGSLQNLALFRSLRLQVENLNSPTAP